MMTPLSESMNMDYLLEKCYWEDSTGSMADQLMLSYLDSLKRKSLLELVGFCRAHMARLYVLVWIPKQRRTQGSYR